MIVNKKPGESDADYFKRVASERASIGFWPAPSDWISRPQEERAFCPTGEGGGIDNTCGTGDGSGAAKHSASTKARKSSSPDVKPATKEVKEIARLIKSGANPKKINSAIRDAIVGKSGWISGYKPGKVLPSEMCKSLGLNVQNIEELDKLMEDSWDHERRGIADLISQMAVAANDDPSGLSGAKIRIDTLKSAAKLAGLSPWELSTTSAFYMPGTDTIHLVSGAVDHDSDSIEKMYDIGYDSTPEFSHVVIHENSHRAHFQAAAKAAGMKFPKEGSTLDEKKEFTFDLQNFVYARITKAVMGDREWANRVEKKIRDISFYATTDPFEGIAEYTTAVRLGYAENDEDLDRFCREMYAPVPKRAKS